MARLIWFNLPAHGHVNPTVAVVRELVARGEDVTVYATEEFCQKYADTGAAFRVYRGLPPYDIDAVTRHQFGLSVFLLEMTERALPVMLDEVRPMQPDYVVHDSMAVWGKYAARVLAVPAIASVSTFAFGREAQSRKAQAASGGLKRFDPGLIGMLLSGMGHIMRHRQSARRLAARWGVPNDGLLDMFANREPLNLVYTSRAFQPGGAGFGADFKFVGPSIAPRPDAPAFPFEQLEGRPLLYISLGTIRNARPDFYRECFAAFDDAAYQVVLSVGGRVDLDTLGPAPQNFIVRRSVPQLEILQRADLFLTHGGMNSVHEGLYYGVPLLVFPQMIEQGMVAQRVAEVGAGEQFPRGEAPAAVLREAAARVLANPAYRAASQQLGDSLREAGGYTRAVDEILAFTRGQNVA